MSIQKLFITKDAIHKILLVEIIKFVHRTIRCPISDTMLVDYGIAS